MTKTNIYVTEEDSVNIEFFQNSLMEQHIISQFIYEIID